MAKGEKGGWRGEEQKESQKDKRAGELIEVIQKIAGNKELLREFLIDLLRNVTMSEMRWICGIECFKELGHPES